MLEAKPLLSSICDIIQKAQRFSSDPIHQVIYLCNANNTIADLFKILKEKNLPLLPSLQLQYSHNENNIVRLRVEAQIVARFRAASDCINRVDSLNMQEKINILTEANEHLQKIIELLNGNNLLLSGTPKACLLNNKNEFKDKIGMQVIASYQEVTVATGNVATLLREADQRFTNILTLLNNKPSISLNDASQFLIFTRQQGNNSNSNQMQKAGLNKISRNSHP